MEDEIDTFDYFNIDINLLTLHVLLEGFYRGQTVFTLEQFLKGDYWKIDEIADEIKDTQDYGSIEDLVLHQVIGIVNDLNIGKVKRISLTTIYGLAEIVARRAIEERDVSEENILFYANLIEEISNLRKLKEHQLEEKLKAGKEFQKIPNRVNFTEDNFFNYLNTISALAAPLIEVEIDFDDEKAYQVQADIRDYIESFYDNDYLDKKPPYREARPYSTKQIENFFEYIQNLPIVDGCINIPFSAMSEQGFEVIKIMTFLEQEKRIKVRNWNDKELWNVKFHKTPVTLSSLFGQSENATKTIINNQEIKLNLSFFPQTATMLLTDQKGKEYKVKIQGQVQKEVIRAVFEHPQHTYNEWSLYDISETLGGEDVDETAVKNAIYQFNRKVKLAIPEVENLFELTKHSAQLNPKYVNKIKQT